MIMIIILNFNFLWQIRLTESGFTQGLHNTKAKNRTITQPASVKITVPVLTTTGMDDGDQEEKENLISNRESSHEYD